MKERKKRILLADAEINLASVFSDFLVSKGFVVNIISDGGQVLTAIQSAHYDLVVMDLNLPSKNGFDLLREVRRSKDIPVIVLTARSAREDIIRAFEEGCDDFITKPFSMDIAVCRINAVLRRFGKEENNLPTTFQFGKKVFDSVRQTIDGQHLSGKENDLLLVLARNEGQVVDRHLLLTSIWAADNYFAARSLAVYVNHLRHFLEGTPYTIYGVTGKGYKLICLK
ncbi:MAG: response regulator transcription factor [Paludibacteraceae bacterium]|nr:response regulator transcription factor [Paludibacteraceae bacterium]